MLKNHKPSQCKPTKQLVDRAQYVFVREPCVNLARLSVKYLEDQQRSLLHLRPPVGIRIRAYAKLKRVN